MAKNKSIYTCQNCGAQRPKWEGKCSDCGEWNSFVLETISTDLGRGWALGGGHKVSHAPNSPSIHGAIGLDQSIEQMQFARITTHIEELDRVLGGGLVQGSFVLVGGSPGVGKSTLLMQMAGGIAKASKKLLYVSSEESVAQTGSRAQRLGIRSPLVKIASESNLKNLMEMARIEKPDVLVVDSIQTIFLPELPAAPGSVSQVRECAGFLMTLAKNENITVLLIGHVTKDGSIAGPKVLEHMVDCVLSFEGDSSYQFRLLRTLKNRFGPQNELGVFQMQGIGLIEVKNPSELFLEERGENSIGSAIFSSMEGSRPLLCEIQALSVQTPLPNPRRTAIGIDINRLHLLCAVLDRHLEMKLNTADIFINVVGGLRLFEPSSDLAVASALVSTLLTKPLHREACYFGEIGLTGEIRAVSFAETRIKEADKLGFKYFVVPKSNQRHLKDLKLSQDKKIIYLSKITEITKLLK